MEAETGYSVSQQHDLQHEAAVVVSFLGVPAANECTPRASTARL